MSPCMCCTFLPDLCCCRTEDIDANVKFDVRVWVLVTSHELSNLSAYIYTVVYGRRCGVSYSLDVKELGDNFIHLTNTYIMKKIIYILIVANLLTGCVSVSSKMNNSLNEV